MKDYYTEFVNLSLQQCTKEDYKYKSRVRKHNRAFKKIEILTNEISKLEWLFPKQGAFNFFFYKLTTFHSNGINNYTSTNRE